MEVTNKPFRLVYEVIVRGKKLKVDEEVLREALKVASSNKVLLHFLRALDLRGSVRWEEEARFRKFLRDLSDVVKALEGLDYLFIKLMKPVVYVPSDIDVLISRKSLKVAIGRLKDRGFKVEVMEPYCITFKSSNSTILDLYLYPTLANVIYLDARRLFEHAFNADFYGLELPTLAPHAEALLSASHAIYKERIYTLNDYLTVSKWLTVESICLAKEVKCEQAIEVANLINELVAKGDLSLPYKLPLPYWFTSLIGKAVRDELTRASLRSLLKSLRDRRVGRQILSKLTRISY